MKTIISAASILVIMFCSFSSCRNSSTKQEAVYQCPMKCEGDKTYDKPGTCPVCGMDLEEVKK
jgi:protein SCO1